MNDASMLRMGMAGRAHGVRGEIGASWQGEYIPQKGDLLFFEGATAAPVALRVVASRWHGNKLLLALHGIADRAAAEALTGSGIAMRKADLPKPAADEAFLADLPGCQVFLPDGACIGKIDHLEFPAGRPLWIIREAGKEDILFPVEAEFVQKLDMAMRQVVIAPPPGLLEVYRA